MKHNNFNFLNLPEKLKMWQFLLLIGIISGTLLALIFNPQMSVIDDNCHYMNVARAIYTGQGYMNINIDPPVPEAYVAPLFPYTLALFMKIAGHAKPVVLIKIFTMSCFLAALILACFIFIRFFKINRWIVFLFAILTPMNIWVSFHSTMILTHSPYILFTTLTILFFLYFRESKKKTHFALATLFTLIAIFFRFPGLPIFFTGFLWLLIRKEYKLASIYFLIVGFVIALWFVPGLLSENMTYAEQFEAKQETSGVLNHGLILGKRFIKNMGRYFLSYIPQMLAMDGGTRIPRRASVIAFLTWKQLTVGITFALVLLFTLIRTIRKKQIFFPILFVAVYFISMSPAVSNMLRYSTYLYFWIMLTIFLFFQNLLSQKNISTFIRVLVVLVFFGIQFFYVSPQYFNLVGSTNQIIANYKGPYELPDEIVETGFYSGEKYYWQTMKAYQWCRDSLPIDSKISGPRRRSGAFYLGRPIIYTDNFDYSNDDKNVIQENSKEFMKWLLNKNASHIIRTADAAPSALLDPAISNYQSCFIRVNQTKHDNERKNIYVLELDTLCIESRISGVSEDYKIVINTIGEFMENGKVEVANRMITYREIPFNEEVKLQQLINSYVSGSDLIMAERAYKVSRYLYPKNMDIPLDWSLHLFRQSDTVKAVAIVDTLIKKYVVQKVVKEKKSEHILAMGLYYQKIEDAENAKRFLSRTLKYGAPKPEYFLALIRYLDQNENTALIDTILSVWSPEVVSKQDSFYLDILENKYPEHLKK